MKIEFKLPFLAFLIALMFTPDIANAVDSAIQPSELDKSLCKLLVCFYNSAVVGVIATIAIIFLGLGVFFGKVNWGFVLTTASGIIVLASADQIAILFMGDLLLKLGQEFVGLGVRELCLVIIRGVGCGLSL